MKHLREQLAPYGANTLALEELILLALGSRSQETLSCLQTLLTTYSSVQDLLNLEFGQLSSEYHLGEVKAAQVQALLELARRLAFPGSREHYQITTAQEAVRFVAPHMVYLDHEEMRVLLLNTKNQVLANLLLYVGTVNCSVLRVAEILRPALTRKCPHVILVHNHPSTDPSPSPEDIATTRQLVEAAKLFDIDVLDHIIIGGLHRFCSLKEQMRW
jgi:DNA repair protein RadC